MEHFTDIESEGKYIIYSHVCPYKVMDGQLNSVVDHPDSSLSKYLLDMSDDDLWEYLSEDGEVKCIDNNYDDFLIIIA